MDEWIQRPNKVPYNCPCKPPCTKLIKVNSPLVNSTLKTMVRERVGLRLILLPMIVRMLIFPAYTVRGAASPFCRYTAGGALDICQAGSNALSMNAASSSSSTSKNCPTTTCNARIWMITKDRRAASTVLSKPTGRTCSNKRFNIAVRRQPSAL